MATLKKESRANKDGTETVRYRVRWIDRDGKRRSRKFKTHAAAKSKLAKVEFRRDMGLAAEGEAVGLVLDAMRVWVDHVEGMVKSGMRERTTWKQYDQHLRLHIGRNKVARLKLRELTAPDCQQFAWDLEKALSLAMARKVFTSFTMGLEHAVKSGDIAINPAAAIKIETRNRKLLGDAEGDKRERAVIPELHEVRATFAAADAMAVEGHPFYDKGRARAILALTTFAGLRISEVRGLGLQHLQLFGDTPSVKVRRRADESGNLGPPKSESGYRTIPLGPAAVAALRAWLEQVRASDDRLVFCTQSGKPYSYAHLWRHVLVHVMTTATMVTYVPKIETLADGSKGPRVRHGRLEAGPFCPIIRRPTYTFHEFRHVAASLWIAQSADPKRIQELMGHSSIQVTMDIYGHLWKHAKDDQALARAAELRVLNARE